MQVRGDLVSIYKGKKQKLSCTYLCIS